MLHEKPISFAFKESRNYVHGTCIYDEVVGLAKDYFGEFPTRLSGSYHKQLKKNGIIQIHDDHTEICHQEIYSIFSIMVGNNEYYMALLEADSAVQHRVPYDEEEITKKSAIAGVKIDMQVNSNYSYIEQFVALTKKMHNYLFKKEIKNWLFSKINLNSSIDNEFYTSKNKLMIVNDAVLGKVMTKNRIEFDGKEIGTIYFTAVR